MIQIKFRGWDSENKKWRYGHFFETVEGIMRCYNIVENREVKFYCSPESIGQFTGLKDKNEKEIYEGDIFLDKVNEAYGIVIFENGCFGIQWYGVDGYLSESGWDENGEFGELDFEPLNSINIDNMKIAGNTYENPKQIKQQ